MGISIGSEKKQRVVVRCLLGDNLEAEAVPLTFPLKKRGGEEVRATPFCYVPNLVEKVITLTEEKEKQVEGQHVVQVMIITLMSRVGSLTWSELRHAQQ